MTVNAYNALSGVNQFKSINGFVPTSGASYLSTKTSFTYGIWETDVITFDYDDDYEEENIIGGDIVISLDTIRTNAEKFGKTYEDELYRVIIHGILHLCGINDKGPGEREIMEAHEDKALKMLTEMKK